MPQLQPAPSSPHLPTPSSHIFPLHHLTLHYRYLHILKGHLLSLSEDEVEHHASHSKEGTGAGKTVAGNGEGKDGEVLSDDGSAILRDACRPHSGYGLTVNELEGHIVCQAN